VKSFVAVVAPRTGKIINNDLKCFWKSRKCSRKWYAKLSIVRILF